MTQEPIAIRYTDPVQESAALQAVAQDIVKILTPNEEILYIALQNKAALAIRKDSVVATTNRLILYRPSLLGRVNFSDHQWQDVKEVHIQQGMLSSEFRFQTTAGENEALGDLHKDQAKRLYGICQQMDQDWREKRRIREMEQDRAKSGGVYVGASTGAPAPAADDPVARLARAKDMLSQGLISEAEFESAKAKILGAL